MKIPAHQLHGKDATHREIYFWLASPERLGAVNEAVKMAGYLGCEIPVPLRLVQGGPLPYFIFPIAPNWDHEAHCGGIYLDIARFVPEVGGSTLYYLPVIGICANSAQKVLLHELQHLADLLDVIEADPTYPDRALSAGFSSLVPDSDEDAVRRCADFEVAKLSIFERKAAVSEFRQGERSIPFQFLFWKLEFPCGTEAEFVQTTLALYVEKLESSIAKRCPALAAFVSISCRAAVDREFASLIQEEVASEVFARRAKAFHDWVSERLPKLPSSPAYGRMPH